MLFRSVNPFREPGLERYWVPSNLESAAFGTRIADDFFEVHTGGDAAFINGVLKVLLARGAFIAAGLLLIPAGVFDVLDGAVARHLGRASRAGAFLDSFLDRISDLIVFGTLTILGLGWALAAGARRRAPVEPQ